MNNLHINYDIILKENPEFIKKYNDLTFSEKICLLKYCNYFYSETGDTFLNHMNILDYKLKQFEENKRKSKFLDSQDDYYIYNTIFGINENYNETYFIKLFNFNNSKIDKNNYKIVFNVCEKDFIKKMIKYIFLSYVNLFDLFNDYFKFSIQYITKLYFSFKLDDTLIIKNPTKSNIFYVNLNRFISTSKYKEIALDYYDKHMFRSKLIPREKYDEKFMSICKEEQFDVIFFDLDINEIQNYCKFINFLDPLICRNINNEKMHDILFNVFVNLMKDKIKDEKNLKDLKDMFINFDPFLYHNKINKCTKYDLEGEFLIKPNENVYLKIDKDEIEFDDKNHLIYYTKNPFITYDELNNELKDEFLLGGKNFYKKKYLKYKIKYLNYKK